jgi:hypothetical protein
MNILNLLQASTPRHTLRHASVIPQAILSPYTSIQGDCSIETQVQAVLCSNLGLPDSRVSAMLSLPEVYKTMEAVPKYEAHLKRMIMMLTMEIGVERSTLAPLVAKYPTFFLPQAPFLQDNLRELRRALAFHFDIFLKTSADELPETWKSMLRQRPDLLLLDPTRAEAVLRWWAGLVRTAGFENPEAATAFVKHILVNKPELLNQKVKILQQEANKVWWHAKDRRLIVVNKMVLRDHSGDFDKRNLNKESLTTMKRNLVGQAVKARFILAYIALNADILQHEQLHLLQNFQGEIQECEAALSLFVKK